MNTQKNFEALQNWGERMTSWLEKAMKLNMEAASLGLEACCEQAAQLGHVRKAEDLLEKQAHFSREMAQRVTDYGKAAMALFTEGANAWFNGLERACEVHRHNCGEKNKATPAA